MQPQSPANGSLPHLKTDGRKILVIYNPIAGQRRQQLYGATLKILGEFGVHVVERRTSRRGDAERFASETLTDEYDAIAVAGGDGTINEAINGLRSTSPPLAIVPLGTANVLAAELNLKTDPTLIAHTIGAAQPSPIHVGIINERKFVMMAGVGIDSHVVQSVSTKLKRITGKRAYIWQTLVELVRFPSPVYTVTIDGIPHEVGSAVFANGHYYGGKFVTAPEARLEDPVLYACLLTGRGRWNLIRYGVALAGNRLTRLSDVTTIEFEQAVIDGPAGDPVHADGDIIGSLPATIRADTTPLHVLRPTGVSKS